MKFRNTLILLLIVAGLGIWVAFVEPKRETTEQRERTSNRVFAFKGDEVSRIELRRDSATIRLERDEKDKDVWRLVEPIDSKADRAAVDPMLSRLEFLERKAVVKPEGGKELALAEYGLDKPRLEIAVTAKKPSGDPVTLSIGGEGTGKSIYARLSTTGEVLVLDDSFWASVDKSLDDLRDKSLVDVERFRVTGLELRYPDRSIMLAKKDGEWNLSAPMADLAESERVDRILDDLRFLKGEKVIADVPEDLAAYGLVSPRVQVVISQGDDRRDTVLLGAEVPDSGGLVYAKNAARDPVYAVKESIVKTVTAQAGDLRRKKVFDFQSFSAEAVTIKKGELEIAAEKKDGRWKLTRPAEAKAEESAVTGLLDKLAALSVKRFVADRASDPKEYGLDPGLVVTIRKSGGTTQTVVLGDKDPDERFLYVKRSEQEPILAVDPAILDAVPASALALRDREIVSLARFRVKRLAIEREGWPTTLEKRDGENWVLTSPVRRDADKDSVDALLNAIAPIEAKELVAEKADDPKVYGFDAPAYRLVVTTEKDTFKKEEGGTPKPTASDEKTETWTLLVGSPSAGAGHHVKVDGYDLVFKMPEAFLTALKKDFIKRDVWDLDREQMTALKIERDGALVSARKGKDGWSLTAPPDAACDSTAVDGVLRALAKLRAEEFAVGVEPGVAEVDEEPRATITVTVETLSGPEEKTVRVGAEKADGAHYASASGEDLTFVLAASSVKALLKDLVPLRLLDLTSGDDVKAIEVSYQEVAGDAGTVQSVAYERAEDGQWKRTQPEAAEPEVDPPGLRDLLGALTTLRASSIASYQPADPSAHGFDSPTLTLSLEARDGKKSTIRLGNPTRDASGEAFFASVEGRPYVYALAKPDADALRLRP